MTPTTAHVLASNTTSINTKQIEEEALRVQDAATRPQRWKTFAKFNLFQDPLCDPPPTPDMTLIGPFHSTDFATLLGHNIADPDTRPRKRRKLEMDTLHHIIPEPHIIPSPTVHRKPDPDVQTRIPPFTSHLIRVLQPTSSAKLRDIYGRMAWIIPIRGAPLIAGTSGAIFSKSTEGEVLMQVDHNTLGKAAAATAIAVAAVAGGHTNAGTAQGGSTLRWTAPTLTSFWMFLLRLHSTSVLGPLSISFQPRLLAPPLRPTPEVGWGLDAFEMDGLDSEEKRLRRCWLSERLAGTDHIKVYINAPFALNFRQLVEAYRDDERVREWCSRDRDRSRAGGMAVDKGREERDDTRNRGNGNNGDKSKPWKPFKGIKLLLVDEIGEPFLIA